jgi:hypothetical protein
MPHSVKDGVTHFWDKPPAIWRDKVYGDLFMEYYSRKLTCPNHPDVSIEMDAATLIEYVRMATPTEHEQYLKGRREPITK